MWFFVQNGRQQGPVSQQEIYSLISQRIITPTTLVWKKGMDNWLVISETEFRDQLPNDTPPPIPDDIPPPIPNVRTGNVVTEQKLQPVRLIRDSFSYAGSVYIPMLAFFVPDLLFSILTASAMAEKINGTIVLFVLINYTCVTPFAVGASIFYVHKNLTQQGVTIADSMHRATEKFAQLVLVTVILLLILTPSLILIIPGLYLSIRLSFVYYAVIIENRSATKAISRSWQLTKGFWWQIFWAFLPIGFVGLFSLLIESVKLSLIEFVKLSLLIEIIFYLILFLFSSVIAIYYVFLFISLVNLAEESRQYI